MSKLELLKKRIDEQVRIDDIVASIFLKMDNAKIPKEPTGIHKAIYNIKYSNDDFGELLQDITFDISGITPYSQQLDRILFRLENANFLGTLNPKYEKYDITDREVWENKIFKKLSDEQKQLVTEMSKEFESIIN